MSDRKLLKQFSWRTPTDEEKERLAYAGKRSRIASYVLLGVVIILVIIPLIYFNDLILVFQNNIIGAVPGTVIYAGMLIFLILRIHLVSKFKVTDVVVDEIVRSNTDNGNYVTATVSQGDAVLTGVTIAMKKHPEAGSKVLLYIENNDTWSVGIV